MQHRFDGFSDFCRGCGCDRADVEDNVVPLVCPDNDHRAYLLKQHAFEAQVDALIAPVYEMLGWPRRRTETKH